MLVKNKYLFLKTLDAVNELLEDLGDTWTLPFSLISFTLLGSRDTVT